MSNPSDLKTANEFYMYIKYQINMYISCTCTIPPCNMMYHTTCENHIIYINIHIYIYKCRCVHNIFHKMSVLQVLVLMSAKNKQLTKSTITLLKLTDMTCFVTSLTCNFAMAQVVLANAWRSAWNKRCSARPKRLWNLREQWWPWPNKNPGSTHVHTHCATL